MKRYLITGGAGFIGSRIAARLLEQQYRVVIVDNLSTGLRANVPDGAELIVADLGLPDGCDCLGGRSFDAVLHLAGQSSGEASFLDPAYDFRSHVVSTFQLLSWCRANDCKRFIYASSMGVYGDPLSVPVIEDAPCNPKSYYGAAKLAAESYIRMHALLGLETTVLRMFNVYGSGQNLANRMQGMASIYLAYLLEGQPIIVKGVFERFRDMIHIDDVVDAWLICLTAPATFGGVFNLGSGRPTTVQELVDALRMAFGRPDYPLDQQPGTAGDQFGLFADISRLREATGWKPSVGLVEGISRMVQQTLANSPGAAL